MKILILTSSDPYYAAGIVATDIYKGLGSIAGNDVKMVVRPWKKYSDRRIIPIESYLDICLQKSLNINYWILNKFNNIFRGKENIEKVKQAENTSPDYYIQELDQTIDYFKSKKFLDRAGFKPDIILVLFMTEFITFKNLYELNKLTGAPILLYLMDMATFTGGCHYSWNCTGYTNECGNCPAFFSEKINDQSHINYSYKKSYTEKTNIFPIAVTGWQFTQLTNSSLFKDKSKSKIMLSVSETQYCPSDKNSARQILNLPFGKKIIFFGAVSNGEKRKGITELIDALKILSEIVYDSSLIHLAIAGCNSVNFADILPFSYSHLGYLDHNTLPKAFCAADVYVSPSIEDSGPMMINQSIMCGTPVVSFEIGVAIDLVKNGETGYRAKLRDINDLAEGIRYILELDTKKYEQMKYNCRELGLTLCHPKEQAKRFMELFEKVAETKYHLQ